MTSVSRDLDLGGVSEVASLLGVSRQQVLNLRSQSGFPAPLRVLSSGPIFDLTEIRAWAGAHRSGPGRPSRRKPVLSSRYRLDIDIGEGGFGTVWRATALKGVGRVVAVKILSPGAGSEEVRRFRREHRSLREHPHPNVVEVLDFGREVDGSLWYAMPLAIGSLSGVLDSISADLTQLREVMLQIFKGVGHLHENGILHRDLKPDNVLQYSKGRWVISDLGLARDAGVESTTLTKTGDGFGTWWYVAPEQWQNARSVDVRSDVFSLGRILQECLLGEQGELEQIEHEALRSVVRKATSPMARSRYETVEEMRTAFENALTGPAQRWIPPKEEREEQVLRLIERLRVPDPDPSAIDEVYDLMTQLLQDRSAIRILEEVAPYLDRDALEELWQRDEEAYLKLLKELEERVYERRFPYDFTDTIAGFIIRAVAVSGDPEALTSGTHILALMGYQHNRWHVRDVLLRSLQSIRNGGKALAAMDGLRRAGNSAIDWIVEEITVGTLHPILREGIRSALAEDNSTADSGKART